MESKHYNLLFSVIVSVGVYIVLAIIYNKNDKNENDKNENDKNENDKNENDVNEINEIDDK